MSDTVKLLGAIEAQYQALATAPLGMQTPWEVKPSGGKPLLYGRSGLLAYGTIATWEEFRLIAALVNAWPNLRSEVNRLNAWVADLQSGMYVNCVYCGHRYGPGETAPVSMADALKAHVAACPQHPMSGLLKVAIAASHALKSYAHANASPELAHSVAAAVDEAIANVQRSTPSLPPVQE